MHDSANINAIKASLRRWGQRIPLIVNAEGVVIAGNGRLEAMRDLGWREAAVITVEESESEASAFAIADNRTAELASWDLSQLKSTIESLRAEESFSGLDAIGWDEEALAGLAGLDFRTDEEAAESNRKSRETPSTFKIIATAEVLAAFQDARERLADEWSKQGKDPALITDTDVIVAALYEYALR